MLRFLNAVRRIGFVTACRMALRLPRYVRFYTGLLFDPRAPIAGKLLVVGALAYVVSPLDFIPDVIPFVGELDDIGLVLMAGNRFLAMCPEHVRREHTIASRLEEPFRVRARAR